MNIETFFEELHEKNWRQNISAEVSRSIDSLIESILSNKDNIVEDVVKRIHNMESLKLEESDEFTYTHFKKWTNKFSKDVLINNIEKDQ